MSKKTGEGYNSNPIRQGGDVDWKAAAQAAINLVPQDKRDEILAHVARPPAMAGIVGTPPTLKPDIEEVGRLAVGVLTRGRTQCECGRWHHDGLDASFALAWHQQAAPLNTQMAYVYVAGHKISAARNEMMRLALVNKSDYLIMVDDDMVVPPFLTQHLYQQAKRYPEAGIVAGWSVSKAGAMREPFVYIDEDLGGGCWFGIADEYHRVQEKMRLAEEARRSGRQPSLEDDFVADRDIRMIEVEAVGTGAVIVNMRWALKVCSPAPEPCEKHGHPYCPHCTPGGPWFQEGQVEDEKGVRTWGQDIWFSRQIRKVGGKILINPMLFIPHCDLRTGAVYGPPVKWDTVPARDLEVENRPQPQLDEPHPVKVATAGVARNGVRSEAADILRKRRPREEVLGDGDAEGCR